MTHFANLKTSISNSLCNLGLTSRTATDDMPQVALPSGVPFDSLRIENSGPPSRPLPALFDSRERCLGDPARLFPATTRFQDKLENPEDAKEQWLDVLDGLKPYGLRGQIAGINTYLNKSADAPALAYLGQKFPANVQWTAPLRVFHNAGSEHIAFAKYLSLLEIGISADRLRLVWIEDGTDRSSRIVLSVTLAGRNYILDNRRADIFEDLAQPYFRPYCSTGKSKFSIHWAGRDDNGWEASLKQLGLHALH